VVVAQCWPSPITHTIVAPPPGTPLPQRLARSLRRAVRRGEGIALFGGDRLTLAAARVAIEATLDRGANR
jgi:hypothetical protein